MTDAQLKPLFTQHIETITKRYQDAMARHGFDHLIIPAGSLHGIFLDDMAYPFKSNFHFNSFVPHDDLNESCLILSVKGERTLCYYQPVDFWHKVAGDPDGFWVDSFTIKMTRKKDEVRAFMPSSGTIAFVGEMTYPFLDEDFDAINPGNLINEINWHRAIKTDYEIECSALANKRAAMGHMAARDMFYNKGSELEIHLAYLLASEHNQAELPYNSIVALNENASILHYMHYDAKRPEHHRTFLIDAGARYNSYDADITRTYAFDKNCEFAELIETMEKLHLNVVDRVKPGQAYVDLHIDTHLEIAKVLNQFKICDMSPESMLESGVTRTFFPHGLGHQIGLQVHDVGGHQSNADGDPAPPPQEHPFLRNTRPIEKNQILTIEPGLYFIKSLLADLKNSANGSSINWDRIEEFRPFGGIRIEDDIAVTETGHRNLTRAFLK